MLPILKIVGRLRREGKKREKKTFGAPSPSIFASVQSGPAKQRRKEKKCSSINHCRFFSTAGRKRAEKGEGKKETFSPATRRELSCSKGA